MKALILNSGTGSRLKNKESCKCLARLSGNTTILDAQITALLRCGIREIYVTTGYNAQLLENYIKEKYSGIESSGKCTFTFIHNPRFDSTNYIYSIYLAREYLHDSDVLLLHGDLIFEQNVLQDVISAKHSVMVVDSTKKPPEKDFKAQLKDDRIAAVSVDLSDNALYAQPLYKLFKQDWNVWSEQIEEFCNNGITGVYAENAFNTVSGKMMVRPYDIFGRTCFEIDNDTDLALAQEAYAKMTERTQTIYAGHGARTNASDILKTVNAGKPFVVCNSRLDIARELLGCNAVFFDKYKSNPDIEDINTGRGLFINEQCDFIVSVGGGSAIDTAKGIKDGIPALQHLAIPTTAGTGSESTQFSVFYRNGEKQTADKPELLPDYVILDPFFLKPLPDYQKKSTLLDALCQTIESLWAKGRTAVSAAYARGARQIIQEDALDYLTADLTDKENILLTQRILNAANLSGKAINISRTTAAHAMSYKLSAVFKIAHGHAVAICLLPVWEHLLKNGNAPDELSEADFDDFTALFKYMDLPVDFNMLENKNALPGILAVAVNTERLGNHPVSLTKETLENMYRCIITANP